MPETPEELTMENVPTIDDNGVPLEFCFQFDDDQPVVFAKGTGDHGSITVHHKSDGDFTALDASTGKMFRLFVRDANASIARNE